jgi:hypothetical protein
MSLTDVNLFRIDGNIGFTSNLQTSALNGGPLAGTRNRIINGDMRIDQRNNGASYTQTGAAGQFSLDRWNVSGDVTSKFSAQQNAGSATPPTGFSNYLGTTSLSAYSVPSAEAYIFRQHIEGYNISDFAWGTASAKTVTLSFWVRSSLTGTFGGAIKNSDNSRSYPISYSIAAANTWEYKTITINGDTSGSWATTNSIGISVAFSLGAGSGVSGTANTWTAGSYWSATGATSVVGTSGATFYITGVQLEPGSTATPFERRSFGQELALCQRYALALTSGQASSTEVIGHGYNSGAGLQRFAINFPTTMRATPTLAFTSGSAADLITDVTGSSPGAFAIENGSPFKANISRTITGGTPGGAGHLRVNGVSDVRLIASSEL